MKRLIILLLFANVLFAQWRGAVKDTTLIWHDLVNNDVGSPQRYSDNLIIVNDTLFFGCATGSNAYSHSYGYISLSSGDSLYASNSKSVGTYARIFGFWTLNNRVFETMYGESINNCYELILPDSYSQLTDYSGHAVEIGGVTVGSVMYSAFTNKTLSKIEDDNGTLTKTTVTTFSTSDEGLWTSLINDTVFVPLVAAFSQDTYPDTIAANKGKIWYYVPATGDTGTYVDEIAADGKIRWLSEFYEINGKKYIVAQGVYPTQGLYEITPGKSVKIATPNDSTSYPYSLAASSTKLFVSTGSTEDDSTLNRVFSYEPSSGEWTVLPAFYGLERSYAGLDEYLFMAAMKFDTLSNRLYAIPCVAASGLLNVSGTKDYNDVIFYQGYATSLGISYIEIPDSTGENPEEPEEPAKGLPKKWGLMR